jgi:hypothetical protein
VPVQGAKAALNSAEINRAAHTRSHVLKLAGKFIFAATVAAVKPECRPIQAAQQAAESTVH